MKTVNAAYEQYLSDSSQLNALLQAVTTEAKHLAKRRKHEDPEAIAQEVAVKVWRSLSAYDPTKASFRTWIHRITNHALIDHARKQRPKKTALALEPSESPTRSISSLDERQRAIAELLSVGYSQEKVAEMNNISVRQLRRLVLPPE